MTLSWHIADNGNGEMPIKCVKISWHLIAITGKALKHWQQLHLGLKKRTGFQAPGCFYSYLCSRSFSVIVFCHCSRSCSCSFHVLVPVPVIVLVHLIALVLMVILFFCRCLRMLSIVACGCCYCCCCWYLCLCRCLLFLLPTCLSMMLLILLMCGINYSWNSGDFMCGGVNFNMCVAVLELVSNQVKHVTRQLGTTDYTFCGTWQKAKVLAPNFPGPCLNCTGAKDHFVATSSQSHAVFDSGMNNSLLIPSWPGSKSCRGRTTTWGSHRASIVMKMGKQIATSKKNECQALKLMAIPLWYYTGCKHLNIPRPPVPPKQRFLRLLLLAWNV